MTSYYLEILKEGLSICLDSDVAYYHYFKVGEILRFSMDLKSGPILTSIINYNDISEKDIPIRDRNGQRLYIKDPQFILDWDKVHSVRLSISSCLLKGIMSDMTISIDRDRKLRELGI